MSSSDMLEPETRTETIGHGRPSSMALLDQLHTLGTVDTHPNTNSSPSITVSARESQVSDTTKQRANDFKAEMMRKYGDMSARDRTRSMHQSKEMAKSYYERRKLSVRQKQPTFGPNGELLTPEADELSDNTDTLSSHSVVIHDDTSSSQHSQSQQSQPVPSSASSYSSSSAAASYHTTAPTSSVSFAATNNNTGSNSNSSNNSSSSTTGNVSNNNNNNSSSGNNNSNNNGGGGYARSSSQQSLASVASAVASSSSSVAAGSSSSSKRKTTHPVLQEAQERRKMQSRMVSKTFDVLSAGKASADLVALVTLELVEARGLLAMDRSGTSDPYCFVMLAGQCYRSQIIQKTLAPQWNETFTFALTGAADLSKQTLVIDLYDSDLIGADEWMGLVRLTLADFLDAGSLSQGRWLPIEHVPVAVADSSSHVFPDAGEVFLRVTVKPANKEIESQLTMQVQYSASLLASIPMVATSADSEQQQSQPSQPQQPQKEATGNNASTSSSGEDMIPRSESTNISPLSTTSTTVTVDLSGYVKKEELEEMMAQLAKLRAESAAAAGAASVATQQLVARKVSEALDASNRNMELMSSRLSEQLMKLEARVSDVEHAISTLDMQLRDPQFPWWLRHTHQFEASRRRVEARLDKAEVGLRKVEKDVAVVEDRISWHFKDYALWLLSYVLVIVSWVIPAVGVVWLRSKRLVYRGLGRALPDDDAAEMKRLLETMENAFKATQELKRDGVGHHANNDASSNANASGESLEESASSPTLHGNSSNHANSNTTSSGANNTNNASSSGSSSGKGRSGKSGSESQDPALMLLMPKSPDDSISLTSPPPQLRSRKARAEQTASASAGRLEEDSLYSKLFAETFD
jgi:hypothetical protein